MPLRRDIVTFVGMRKTFLDGATQGLGARFKGRNAIGATAWTTVGTIVEYEPDACFAWAVGEPDEPSAGELVGSKYGFNLCERSMRRGDR